MELNQTSLRTILATVLSVDPKYVVPKQGNWWNPQDQLTEPKPSTWCAYRIGAALPLTLPFYDVDAISGEHISVEHRVATITLQFVGAQAEDLANSVGHWIHRQDVRVQLATISAQLYGDSSAVTVTDFSQEGNNDVLAYNTSFRLVWASRIATGLLPIGG